jgi:hypothetical protein
MTASRKQENEQLGNLLIDAEIVTSDVVEIALQISAGFGESLVQVLADTHRITESDVQNVLQANDLVNTGKVQQLEATQALKFAHKTKRAFNDSAWSFLPLDRAA